MKLTTITASALAAASLAGVALTTAGAASASTTSASLMAAHQAKPIVATTVLHNRPDSGGNGTWAFDTMTRTLTLTYLGKSADPAHAAAPYMYSGSISDSGTFLDIPGAYTPNQGGHDLGKVLLPRQVSGPMSGEADFGLFYASAKAGRVYVPASLPASQNANPAYATGTWVDVAFPAGTTFSGIALGDWSWGYSAVPAKVTVIVHGKRVIKTVYRQQWTDAWNNGAGQTPKAGNITGLR
jgi:hypothetical protein